MPTILDYYKYAVLSAASYVRMGAGPYTGARLAELAPAQSGGRLPLVLGQYWFDPENRFGNPVWNILHYHGGDVPGVVDETGFAATLFERQGEKVLAIRGAESGSDFVKDSIEAGLGEIGVLVIAISQTVRCSICRSG